MSRDREHDADRDPEQAAREVRLRQLTDNGEIISGEEYKQRSRRAFLSIAGLGVAGYAGFRTLQNQSPREGENIPRLLRSGFEWNERVWSAVQRGGASARTFAISDREELRINGRHGLRGVDGELIEVPPDEASNWQIELVGADGTARDPIPLAAIKSDFEVHDMVWEHKCIEGWSNIAHWTGVRVSDVLAVYAPDETAEWAVLRTPAATNGIEPEREYTSAVERYTMQHHQTLFAWQLNGEPLTAGHGSPVRLVTPLKYGIKQLKRVGAIEFTNDRPTDYWTTRGYDLHAGF